MGIAERLYSKVFAMNEPKGYYELHRVQYQLPKEVQRLEVGNGECQRVTKLNARSLIGVSKMYQSRNTTKYNFSGWQQGWALYQPRHLCFPSLLCGNRTRNLTKKS